MRLLVYLLQYPGCGLALARRSVAHGTAAGALEKRPDPKLLETSDTLPKPAGNFRNGSEASESFRTAAGALGNGQSSSPSNTPEPYNMARFPKALPPA